MSNILNPAWKYKKEVIDIFDKKFLNEKDLALQPLNFLFEESNNINNNNSKSINSPPSPKNKNQFKEKQKKKSLRNSGLYSSNIIIVQSISDGDSEDSSLNQIEKEVNKLKKLLKRSKSKKYKKKNIKQKGNRSSNSAKF